MRISNDQELEQAVRRVAELRSRGGIPAEADNLNAEIGRYMSAREEALSPGRPGGAGER